MRKIRIIILFLFVILLTGCKGEYNLIINKDLSLSENIKLSIDNKDGVYEKTMKLFEDNNIDDSMYNVTQTDDYVNIQYKEDFRNFEDYFLNSKFYSRLFTDENYNKDNKEISYSGIANLKFDDSDNSDLNNSFNITDLKIKVDIPFSIKNNNADKVEKNSLTWILKKNDSNKRINFTFDYLKSNNLYLLIIIICLAILISSASIIIRNYLKERGI